MMQKGQTLIETIIAIFILTTGLSSGLALAIFAFGSASDITEKVAATGLAREGTEAVRRMRDSNWLSGAIGDCGGGQQCYTTWLTGGAYPITGAFGEPGRSYRLDFNPLAQNNKWTLNPAATDYRLRLRPGAGFSHSGTENTNFFRKIFIIQQTNANPAAEYQILARSVVWWHGKNCPAITDYSGPSDTKCKIVTEENLTNWKNY